MCSPAGPITVDNGTVIHMQCSSETGNPAVTLVIYSTKCNNRYTWTTQTIDDTTVMSLDLTVDVTDEDVTFECIISSVYFPDMTRSCTIGPIMVRNTIELTTTESTLTSVGPSFLSNNQQSSSNPWIIAFVVSTILLAASSSINIIFIFRDIKHKRDREPDVPKADPYMELQPTDDKNRVYMEPTVKETTTAQDTYYQPVEVQNESLERDYARPEDSTSYEAVGVQQSDERQYQNINS